MLVTSDTHERAEQLLSEAFRRKYRYPDGMPSFDARVRYGDETAPRRARLVFSGPGSVAVQADSSDRRSGIADVDIDIDAERDAELDDAWLLQEARALSRLCWLHDYERGEGKFAKSLVSEPHPLGPLVLLRDDPHEATFRILDGRVTLMTRRTGTLVERVQVDRWHEAPDGRFLPARWRAEFWDDSCPDPLRIDRYWDLYKPLIGEMYPMLRRVESSTPTSRAVRLMALREWRQEGRLLDPEGPVL